ncbi:MAG: ribonuclease HII [Candidatus Omnitrophota bacterium]
MSLPTPNREHNARRQGYKCVAGIDEAGRGPIAGPVVACCVVLKRYDFIARIDDSKRLTALLREKAYKEILEKAFVGIGIVHEDIIKRINIANATILAMRYALYNLPVVPDLLLVDGILSLKVPQKQVLIIKGDQKSLSIAAASIIAKVTRDRLMVFYDELFPKYGLAVHKGYGTKTHFETIDKFGLSPLHRGWRR